jgi:hypothetical protein
MMMSPLYDFDGNNYDIDISDFILRQLWQQQQQGLLPMVTTAMILLSIMFDDDGTPSPHF